MRIHFFTIVLNGMPFIQAQYAFMRSLTEYGIDWSWHIVEGVADLKHDTSWSVANGATITERLHTNGLSNDGTTEFLNQIEEQDRPFIKLYRKPAGEFWDGKLEMVNAPLGNVPPGSLLWQLDVDEFWTPSQIDTIRELFLRDLQLTSAMFWCDFFVGPNLKVVNRRCYGNHPEYEWKRVHRMATDSRWLSHEPPVMTGTNGKCLSHRETEDLGCVFKHQAYVMKKQLAFKEDYYGYCGAVGCWQRLQEAKMPVMLKDFFPWVHDNAIVDYSGASDEEETT